MASTTPNFYHSTLERSEHKSYRTRTFSAKPGGLRPRRGEDYRTSVPETEHERHVRPLVSKGRFGAPAEPSEAGLLGRGRATE
jgi:hypothetical protein